MDTNSQTTIHRVAGSDTGSHMEKGESTSHSISRDDREMRRLGKKPVLQRNFNFISLLGFSCTVLITWEGILVGGPGGVIFGFLLVWIGTMSTFAVISELASMRTILVSWVAKSVRFKSVMTKRSWAYDKLEIDKSDHELGWTTFAGWQAVVSSSGYLLGTLIQALIIYTHPTYVPTAWQGMLLYWAVIMSAVFVNTVASRALAKFEGVVLVVHLFGFLAVLIPLVYLGPHGDASVYTTFLNEGGWSTKGLSFFVGLSGSTFTLLGADSAVHLAEEIKNASVVIPRALMTGLFINGLLGFSMILALMICMGDVQNMMASLETLLYPFIEVFNQATNSIAGATIMASIVVFMGICATVGALASASRMQWSFARDRGLPFWQALVKLDPRTSIPVYSVGLSTIISILLSLVTLGSSIAFTDLVSLTVSGLYSSYLICCVLLLWRRCKHHIKSESEFSETPKPYDLVWGPWRVPGLLGIVNNVFACIFLVVLWFFSFWPPATPVNGASMNYAVVLSGGVLSFGLVWYLVYARKMYTGPIVEVMDS